MTLVPSPATVSRREVTPITAEDVYELTCAVGGPDAISIEEARRAAVDLHIALDQWLFASQAAARSAQAAHVRRWSALIVGATARMARVLAANAPPSRVACAAANLLERLGLDPEAAVTQWRESDAAVHLIRSQRARDVPDSLIAQLSALARKASAQDSAAILEALSALADAAGKLEYEAASETRLGRPEDAAMRQFLAISMPLSVQLLRRGAAVRRSHGEGGTPDGPTIQWHHALFKLIKSRQPEFIVPSDEAVAMRVRRPRRAGLSR